MKTALAIAFAAVAATAGAAALAQPVDGRTARKAMFAPTGVAVEIVDGSSLGESDQALLTQILAQQAYYGAVAMTKSEGLMSEALIAAANYHDVASARTAALAGCDARKKPDSDACVIVAELRPEGWEPRALQLSASATEGLQSGYRGFGARALAISPSTGQWAIGKGRGAPDKAVQACEAKGGAGDCTVVVAD